MSKVRMGVGFQNFSEDNEIQSECYIKVASEIIIFMCES